MLMCDVPEYTIFVKKGGCIFMEIEEFLSLHSNRESDNLCI